MAKQTRQLAGKVKHHKKVIKILKQLLKAETFKTVKGDQVLAAAIRARGVFASHGMVRDIRLDNKIPNAYERRMAWFSKEAGKK